MPGKKLTAKAMVVKLKELDRVPARVAKETAKQIAWEISLSFDRGVDPYGRPWRPLAASTIKRGRFPPPLTKSHRGRWGIKVRPKSGAGLSVTSSVPYMRLHQRFDSNDPRPTRKFLPERRLPDSWARRFQTAYDREFKKAFG